MKSKAWLIGLGALAAGGVAYLVVSKKPKTMTTSQVNTQGFSTVAGQSWIDAGVWLAYRFEKDKVTPTESEKQFIIVVFTDLGVDNAGIIRYAPTSAQVAQAQAQQASANVSQPVRTIVADFISDAMNLPSRVLV